MNKEYDVIVVGGGHAGIEAALATSRLGLKTLLFTIYLDNIAMMSCNPAIGGPGKSHLVSELGLLGGEMASHIDFNNLQIKQLNHTKGLAARIVRAQADKYLYRINMREKIEKQENLFVLQGIVEDIKVEKNKIVGVIDNKGIQYKSKATILCTGTFLKGRIIIGDVKYPAGRQGENSSENLSDRLKEHGLEIDRYQTATPPRIDKKTIDFSKTEEMKGMDSPKYFSHYTEQKENNNIPTWLTYTTNETIEVAKEMLEYSPIVTGIVSTKGPRHCPSLDRKVLNFPEKTDHQIFLEQESMDSNEIYVNGFTTAMPPFAQEKILKTIKGLEKAKIVRYGYAVEYDYVPAYQLNYTLETKKIENLYLAGTINGTSGYEEAACQGFVAGVNAAKKIKNEEEVIFSRTEGYIGVLIDDIITKETPEPYRVLPSRAEYRLTLRQDNVFLRLLEKAEQIGIVDKLQIENIKKKKETIEKEIERLKEIKILPNKEVNEELKELGLDKMNDPSSAFDFLSRKGMTYKTLEKFIEIKNLDKIVEEQVEINAKYKIFIEREENQISKVKEREKQTIPKDINFDEIEGISNIAKSGLISKKPKTIGDAIRITGVTHNDINILISYINYKQ